VDHSVAAMEEILGEIGTLRIWDLLTYFDDKYIKPVVLHNYSHQDPQLMHVREK
jgi:hypothetical protein